DPPVRVQIAGASAALRPGRPMMVAHLGRTICGSSKTCIAPLDHEPCDAPETEERSRADRRGRNI
ncbi:MAG: hypothetical protein KDK29_20105, partial [Sedimentitalea sp.]|nr:hypothetical protein [Sedimentitalea sp.]